MTNDPRDTDDLDGYLRSLEREEAFRVDEVLKESPFETTQLVSFVAANGSSVGPFVRKLIARDAGIGSVYGAIFAAQARGLRFVHIPRVYDCYRTDEKLVAVMEYVPGATLAEVVGACGGPGERLAVARRLFPQLCDAVSELHEEMPRPVVHRDLKPENVVVPGGRSVVLIDFGIARAFRQGESRDTHRFGTCEYAPPEQYGFGQTDVRSDVYALGLVLWFCCTGRVPAARDRDRGFAALDVAPAVQQVVARAAAFDPAARYASARELKRAFEAAVGMPAVTVLAAPAVPARVPSPVPANVSPTAHPVAWAAAHLRRLQDRVPDWVGRVWNAAVLAVAALFLVVCVNSTIDPPPSTASDPLWFRVYEYLVFMGVLVFTVAYLLLDKRRLRRRFALLRGRSLAQDAGVLGCAFAVALALLWLLGRFV